MDEEELERTGMISKIISDEEVTVEERLEEVVDRLDYNDLPIWKKNHINELISEIKEAKSGQIKEKKFEELMGLMEE